jgi:hypothetical protein
MFSHAYWGAFNDKQIVKHVDVDETKEFIQEEYENICCELYRAQGKEIYSY